MPERTPRQAVAIQLEMLNRMVSCITQVVLTLHSGYQPAGTLADVRLGNGSPVRLQGPERIHLRVRLRLQLTQVEESRGYWDADLAAYEYRLSD
ncbi:MAG: hypothetical protein AB7K36_29920, partial [Chloroflexota bacterium]